MTRWLAGLAVASFIGVGILPAASAEEAAPSEGTTQGMEEMHRFCTSERMPQATSAMMQMARQIGDGDPMTGMVRMMEMMGGMGQMGGMMAPGTEGSR